MTDDTCGYDNTLSGEPCSNPQSEADGRCWIHTTNGDEQRGHHKLSHDRQEKIALAIEEGVPVVAACRLNGITFETHRTWMGLGEEQDEGPFAEYSDRLARALGHDQREKTFELWEAAKASGDSGTMLTILKQRYPETWSEMDIGEAGDGVTINLEREIIDAADQ